LEDGTLLPLANLRPNDRVLTIDVATKQPFFDDVIGFLHYSQHGEMEVMRLHTDDGKTVTLSPKHLIYTYNVNDHNVELSQPKFASEVKPGDFLIGVEGFSEEIRLLNSTALRVTEVSTGISNSGIYAPLTKSGNIVVDSAVASCYAQVRSHRIAHWAMGPLRVVHSLSTLLARTFECESLLDSLILDSHNRLGILNYAYLLETLVPDFLFSRNIL
jgi:intein/homing endonuclease